jgi:heme oxygenase
MTENMSTAAELVKKATAQAHASTEKVLIRYVKNIRTPQDYASLLYCMYGYYAPMEERLEPLTGDFISDSRHRRKASRLLDDLHALAFPAPLHIAHSLPAFNTPAEALGCQYVLEGSTLGGVIIKKMIIGQCNAIPGTAYAFFSGYGDDNRSMWLSFLNRFNAAVTTETDIRMAVAAANACFARLEEWISTFYTSFKGGLQ